MEPAKNPVSKLFSLTVIDYKDKFEEKYERAYQNLQTSIYGPNGANAKELNSIITSMLSLDNKQQEDLQLGFIYIMLTDSQLALATLRDLHIVTRDGLQFIINHLTELVDKKFQKLAEIAKHQLLWLFKELLVKHGPNQPINGLLWALLRHACGGDISARNIMWIEGILDILVELRPRFDKYSPMVGLVAYSYVRLIEDHNAVHLIQLRNKETKFVVGLIRDRFQEIIILGRDFIRLLQNVSRIPEFHQLWKDMVMSPRTLSPNFTGIFQMMQLRTSRHYIGNRITSEMESKLHFFTSNVKFGNHKRYQDWFQDRYFSTPESQSLRSDVIRYIINVIHPTNELLGSDVTPRWAIIGWLLTTCTNPVALCNAKLSIFYDWLCFDPLKDNIMNIEPGILVMYHSLKNVPGVTSTMLDFLCRIMKNFYPRGEEVIRSGVSNSLKIILEKQVIPCLTPIFESAKLDPELRASIRENFREFLPQTPTYSLETAAEPKFKLNNCDAKDADEKEIKEKETTVAKTTATIDEPQFSDDESSDEKKPKIEISSDEDDDDDDLPLSEVRLKKDKTSMDKVDLPDRIRDSFEKLLASRSLADYEEFYSDLKACSSLDSEQETYVLENLVAIFNSTTLPDTKDLSEFKNLQKLEESINLPLFGVFKVLLQQDEKSSSKKCAMLTKIIDFCHAHSPSMGCYLLYYLKVHAKLASKKNDKLPNNYRSSVYKTYCQLLHAKSSKDSKLNECLDRDLLQFEQNHLHMFLWVLPEIYREFDAIMVNNSKTTRLVVGCVDSRNLQDLIFDVTQGKLKMFKNEGVIEVVRDSLKYETFEQMCLWQLLQAHDVPISSIQEILPDLEASNNEALTNIFFMLKREEPSEELVKLLLSREIVKGDNGDAFVTSSLRHWCIDYEEQLSEIIAGVLLSKYPQTSPTKRKRTVKSSNPTNEAPSAELVLGHLEHLRRSCRYGSGGTALYLHEKMQRALQQAFAHVTDSQKKQFSELFSLAVEDETTVNRRGTSSRGGRKAPAKKETSAANSNSSSTRKSAENSKAKAADAYSSDESSDEEKNKSTKQPAKRRRKVAESDSD